MAQAWHSGGNGGRSLRERYSEVAGELAALGHQAKTPISEQALFDNIQLLERVRPAPVWDEQAAIAGREFEATIRRYREVYGEVVKAHGQLARIKNDPIIQLLGVITDEVLRPPVETQAMLDTAFGRVPRADVWEVPGKVYSPNFNTAAEYRQANARVVDRLLGLQIQQETIRKVLQLKSSDPAQQACKAVIALQRQQTARMSALQERIDALESVTGRVAKRLRSRRKFKEEVK